ncbi:MAG: hypothetical protein GXP53_09595 [Deltaproteobacteria bacterium]|nr:hypothetical protein [Deltaproteobacteria bacterium]
MRTNQKNAIITVFCFVTAFFFVACGYLWAGEHPSEHPTEQAIKQTKAITKDALATAVENYVNTKSAAADGYFSFVDPKANKALSLTLVRVHKDRLARINKDTYFACADFKEKGGDMYDLDIFMQGQSAEQLKMTDIAVHKKNDKPRYTWVKDNGLWKRNKI